jgi:Tol biopolymer transport system component
VLKRPAWLFLLVTASLAVFASVSAGAPKAGATSSSARILFASSRAGAWTLYSMNPDGSDQSRFAGNIGGIQPGAGGDGIGVPQLTPDGSEVLVPSKGTTAIALATGARRPLANCAGPVISSPDGTALACSANTSKNAPSIYVIEQPGGPKLKLPGTKWATPAAWSPDGNWILFSLESDAGPYDLWRVHPDGTGLQRLSRWSAASPVLWLPDGRAEYVGGHSANLNRFDPLVVLDVNTGKADILRKIASPASAAWSPDGTTLVYATNYYDARPSRAIYTVDVSGSTVRRLTPKGEDVYDSSPSWSPDGTKLAFVRQTDSGVDRYASEVWTMNADGSQQRRLTQPYPDEGENVYPLWVNGPVAVTGEPQPQAAGSALKVPFFVAGVVARNARVAVAPDSSDSVTDAYPTPPLLVWHPGSRRPESLVGALCGSITPEFFAGSRLAITCNHDFLDEHEQAILDFDLRSRVPAEPLYAYSAFFGRGAQFGTVVDGPVFSGGRIEFETSHWTGPKGRKKSQLPRQVLWAAHGSHRTRLAVAHRLGTLVAGDESWLAFTVATGIEITSPRGRPVTRIRVPALRLSYRVPAASYLLTGSELLRFGGGKLEGWDVGTGALILDRSVPARAQLQAADDSYVVYSIGADLHVVSATAEKVIHTPAFGAGWNNVYQGPPSHPVTAALSPAGLFYAYDVKSSTFPGRVVFVPRSKLPR